MLMDGLRWMKSKLLELFFPRRCPVCDEILEPELVQQKIHPECQNKLEPVIGTVCMQCGRPLESTTAEFCYDCHRRRAQSDTAVHQGKALYLYQGAVKQTMYRFKYSNKREYADFFAEYAQKRYGSWIQAKGIEVIVPVPMYRKKQRIRGYNQAESFASALSQLMNIPVDFGVIQRVKDTTPQKELDDIERKKNLKSAFQSCENIVQYKRILVVDDIYTTGSTAEAVAEELKKTKDVDIYFLSICIGKGM